MQRKLKPSDPEAKPFEDLRKANEEHTRNALEKRAKAPAEAPAAPKGEGKA